nr:ribosomal protein S3 [Neorhodomela munita]
MSKKISLKSKYLGLSNKWPLSFQNYGQISLKFKNYFLNFFIFFSIIEKKLFLFQNLLFSNIELFVFNKFLKININLVYLRQLNLKHILKFLVYFEQLLLLNFSSLVLKTWVYFEKKNFLSNIFIKSYIDYLITTLNYFPKKIFNFLIPLLKTMLNKKKISFSNHGIKITQLKGIKIQLKGRYELTKNPMSKRISFKMGKISSMNLNTKIEFLNKTIYTKLGKSSIKVWLFYFFEQNNNTI